MLFPGFDLSMGGEMWFRPSTNSILGSIKGPYETYFGPFRANFGPALPHFGPFRVISTYF